MDKGKLLGIDYGQKTIGLAVSDQDRLMAFGRGSLKNVNKQKIAEKIIQLVKIEQIQEIIIGLPLGPNGEETAQTVSIKNFADFLQKYLIKEKIRVKIAFLDESFSSFEADRILAGLGVKGLQRKKTEDEMAAIILIHRYIDFKP